MPLKHKTVTVPEWAGRDAGKTFRIDELDALRAEKWAYRMYLALKGTSGEIPQDVASLGIVGIAIVGINTILAAPVKFEDLEPLLDEMLGCVRRIRDPRHPDVVTPLIPGDIEEVATLMWLRSEVLSLHTGFSPAAALSELLAVLRRPPSPDSPTTPTSPA